MIDPLLSRRLIFVTGKGGVGKSSVTAALGLALADRGQRVLLVETDTYSAMADLFDRNLENSKVATVRKNLDIVNLHAEDALVHAIKQFVPSDRVARTVIQNRIARVFFKAAPSVNEFSILNMVRHYLEQKNGRAHAYDHVIVDLPASGHAVTYLNVPDTLHGMVRVGRFAQISKELGDYIRDTSKTALVAVCLPEEMPVNETIELADALHDTLGRKLTTTMLNMVHKQPFEPTHRELFDVLRESVPSHAPNKAHEASPLSRLIHGNALALDWYERDLIYVEQLRERIQDGVEVIELPMVYEQTGIAVLEKLADYLNGKWSDSDSLAS